MALVALLGIGLAAGTVLLLHDLRARTLDETGRALESRALTLADQAERAFEAVWIMQSGILDMLSSAGVDTAEEFATVVAGRAVHEAMRVRIGHAEQVDALSAISHDGRLLNSSRFWPVPQIDLSDRDYFAALRDDESRSFVIGEPFPSRVTGNSTMYLVRRVSGPGGGFLGAIAGAVELAYFNNLYATVSPFPGTSIGLFRSDGLLLARHPEVPRTIGRHFGGGDVFRQMLDGREQVLDRHVSMVDGQERLFAMRRLKRLPMLVSASVTLDAALASWRRLAVLLVGAALMFEVVIIGLWVMLARQFAQQCQLAEARVAKEQAEQQTQVKATELEMLNQSMPAVLVRLRRATGDAWDVLYIAPSIEAITGFPPEEASRPGWLATRLSDADGALLRVHLDRALTLGASSVEVGFTHADGSLRRFTGTMRAGPMRGGVDDVIMIWMDVTRERNMAQQLAQAEKLASLGQVATGMAHELNQPLSAISMASENMSDLLSRAGLLNSQLSRKLSLITDQAMRMAAVIDHMRVFGRVNPGPSEALDLPAVLRMVQVLASPKLRASECRLALTLPERLPATLGKAVPLEQVLVNLVVNACDAYRDGGAPEEARVIRLGVAEAEGCLSITVRDAAGGIAPDVLPRIFEPFFTTKPAGEGTGLGLSISYGIIREMGGTITAANEGGGTVFTITLPLADPASGRAQIAVPALPGGG